MLALLAGSEPSFRRTARRCSLCAADAEDAFQRAVEILLTKGPDRPGEQLAAWMHVVTRREALAVRRARERLLGPAPRPVGEADPPSSRAEAIELLPCRGPSPEDRLAKEERVAAARAALARLTRDQRTAIGLQAAGYSYAEICRMTGWTYTKVNRSLAEGRARLRSTAGRRAPSRG